jgi:hypothetical protein
MQRSIALLALATALATALAACASGGASGGASTGVGNSTSDRLSATEVANIGGTTAYDVVSRLRPRWLRANATGSISDVRSQVTLVYLDGQKLGGLEALKTVSASGIQSMQFLDAVRAATVLTDIGSDPVAGAILILTSR